MKIRITFITNSSSVSHVVFVPKRFNITVTDKIFTDEWSFYETDFMKGEVEDTKEEVVQHINVMLDILKKGEEVCRDGCKHSEAFNILGDILHNSDLILSKCNTGPDSESFQGVSSDTITKCFLMDQERNLRDTAKLFMKK